jgi:hypothetical protein
MDWRMVQKQKKTAIQVRQALMISVIPYGAIFGRRICARKLRRAANTLRLSERSICQPSLAACLSIPDVMCALLIASKVAIGEAQS